jgi:hypothetical protein
VYPPVQTKKPAPHRRLEVLSYILLSIALLFRPRFCQASTDLEIYRKYLVPNHLDRYPAPKSPCGSTSVFLRIQPSQVPLSMNTNRSGGSLCKR